MRQVLAIALLVAVSAVMVLQIDSNLAPLAAPTAPSVARTNTPPAAPKIERYRRPPYRDFGEIVRRPLFKQSRALPKRQPSAAAPAAPVSLRATLKGVLYSPTERVALLTPAGSDTVVRVPKGEAYQGWRLKSLTPDSATFTRGRESVTLKLTFRGDE